MVTFSVDQNPLIRMFMNTTLGLWVCAQIVYPKIIQVTAFDQWEKTMFGFLYFRKPQIQGLDVNVRNDFEECRGASSIPTTITIIGYHYGILFINIIGKFGRPLSFDEPMFLILTPDTHTQKKCCLKCLEWLGPVFGDQAMESTRF